jgi:hypothetical protein
MTQIYAYFRLTQISTISNLTDITSKSFNVTMFILLTHKRMFLTELISLY